MVLADSDTMQNEIHNICVEFTLNKWLIPNGTNVDKNQPIAIVTFKGVLAPDKTVTLVAPAKGRLEQYLQPSEDQRHRVNHVHGNTILGRINERTKACNLPRLYFLYDTSYLMSTDGKHGICDLVPLVKALNGDRWVLPIEKKHILANEVKMEIHGLLKNNDKNLSASKARLLCAAIIAYHEYEDIDLGSYEEYTAKDSLLGPDSAVDKKLLQWAYEKAQHQDNVVYIASCDGGILTEACRLQREEGVPVLCHYTKNRIQDYYNHNHYESLIANIVAENPMNEYFVKNPFLDIESDLHSDS